MNDDVICVGFRPGRDIHLLCTPAGLDTIPPPVIVDPLWVDGYHDVFLAIDNTNLVALRLMGLITDNDVRRMLNR